jgi:Protein of unknown function (DUF1569)
VDTYLQRLRDAVTSATVGMNAEDLTRHPEGKWSTAQVLEHLYLSYSGTVKGFQRCLEAGKPLARAPLMKDRMRTFVVTGLGHLPTGRQAPERTRPRGMAVDEITRGIAPQILAMDEVIAQCEARFGKCTRVLDHPVLGPLTARQWRKFHWIHGRHHLKQIQKLRGQGKGSDPSSTT